MKLKLLLSTLLIIMISGFAIAGISLSTVRADTNVTGIITQDTTWTLSGSPYTLTGNILVDNGVTLIIEAGTTVNLNGYYIMVNGTLQARGNSTQRIIINDGEITFTEFSTDWNESSSTGCILENAILNSSIEANISIKINSVVSDGFIDIQEPGKPIISNNTLRGGISIDGDGIIANNTILNQGITVWENATVTGNIISGCPMGIQAKTYFWDDYNPTAWPNCTSLIEGNLVIGNTNGIVVAELQGAYPGRPIIQNNTIICNSVGIYVTWVALGSPSPTILNNNINNNSDYNFRTNVPDDVNATYNWWGTTNTSIIDKAIYDFYDDFVLGKVTYLPLLNQSNPNAPTVQFYDFNVSVETQSFDIAAISNSIVSELSFNLTLKELKFNVEGMSGTTGFCSITIPAILMNGTFSLYKNEVLLVENVEYTETYNETCHIFRIFYNHSSHTIRIVSSQVYPEFPSNLLLVLIIMFLSAATLFFRKKLLKSQN